MLVTITNACVRRDLRAGDAKKILTIAKEIRVWTEAHAWIWLINFDANAFPVTLVRIVRAKWTCVWRNRVPTVVPVLIWTMTIGVFVEPVSPAKIAVLTLTNVCRSHAKMVAHAWIGWTVFNVCVPVDFVVLNVKTKRTQRISMPCKYRQLIMKHKVDAVMVWVVHKLYWLQYCPLQRRSLH